MAAHISRRFTSTNNPGWSAEAYSLDGGRTWKWASNGRYCPVDACQDMGIPADLAAQEKARHHQVACFLARYRREQANRQPSGEQLAEMRAAFGPGTTVVNVITGRRTRL